MVIMNALASSVIVVLCLEQAPSAEIVPSQSFDRLAGLFVGREFLATQVTTRNSPTGAEPTDTAQMHIRSCPDAVVIRSHRVSMAVGHQNNETDAEYRWLRGQKLWETRLASAGPFEWPAEPDSLPKAVTLQVVRYDVNDELAWGPGTMIVSDLASSLDHTQITFSDMCSNDRSWGFRQEGTAESSDDGQQAKYVFVSPEFGRIEATFKLLGSEWLPTVARISRIAEHKMVPDGVFPSLGAKNRVGNYRTFTQFTKPNATLDSLELAFAISYDSDQEIKLPKSIRRTDVWRSGSETASMETILTVDHVKSENISCESVLAFALNIRDGTDAVVAHSNSPNIKWTIRDGAVVKKIDSAAIADGTSATFSPRSYTGYLVALNFIAVALCVLVWRVYAKRKD
jgi:hypothetical protein